MSVTLEGLKHHNTPAPTRASHSYRLQDLSRCRTHGSQMSRLPHHKGFTGTAHCYTFRTKDPYKGMKYCQRMKRSCFRMVCMLQSKTFLVRGKTNVFLLCEATHGSHTPTHTQSV